MNGQIAVDEKGIETLCSEILQYADQLSDRISAIDAIVNKIGSNYDTESGTKYEEKMKLLYDNATTSCRNIIGYAEDLIDVKSSFQQQNSEIAGDLQAASSKIDK